MSTLAECRAKFDQFTSLASMEALKAELQRRQGLASEDATMNVAVCDPDTSDGMADSLDDMIAQYNESRHRLTLAARRVVLSTQFFQGMEAIMAGAGAEVIQALAVFKDHLKDNDAAAQAIITIAKAAPTNAEMVQIKSAVADMQAGVDADTAAMNDAVAAASGSGSETPPVASSDPNTF